MDTQESKPEQLFNIDAERALVGAALINPGCMASLDITHQAFYLRRHGHVWRALEKLHNDGIEADILTVMELLERSGKSEEVGGMPYLLQLINDTPTSISADNYARIIKNYAQRRAWKILAGRIAKAAYDTNIKLEEEAAQVINDLLNSVSTDGAAEHISNYADQVFSETLDRMNNPRDVWGIETGFKSFDKATGGLQTGEVLYLTGEPGVGKSIFVMQMALQMATNGTPGAIYSLEMPGTQVVRRLLSYLAKVKTKQLKAGTIDPDDIPRIEKQILELHDIPLFMSDSVGWTTTAMRADLARLKVQHGVRWFVLDYAYLLKDGAGMSENDKTGFISAQIKGICRSLDMAGVVIHSLRKSGLSGNASGADLRGSGQQFYDTDVLLFINKVEGNDNMIRFTFGKGRELENPRQFFELRRVPNAPAFAEVAKEMPF